MEEQKLFQIGEVARLFHLSVSSLRHYEAAGLLTPEYVDPSSHYRYYSVRQFEVLNTIRYLRALDMPLAEIAAFLKNRDIPVMEEKLRQQKAIVAEKARELKRIERKIDNRLQQLSDAQRSVCGQVRRDRLRPCRIAWVKRPLKIRNALDMEAPCVSIRFRGGHTEARTFYERLLSYIRENALEVAGFSREITMVDYGLTSDTEKFVTEISIPVTGPA